jgi:hypothetical protein
MYGKSKNADTDAGRSYLTRARGSCCPSPLACSSGRHIAGGQAGCRRAGAPLLISWARIPDAGDTCAVCACLGPAVGAPVWHAPCSQMRACRMGGVCRSSSTLLCRLNFRQSEAESEHDCNACAAWCTGRNSGSEASSAGARRWCLQVPAPAPPPPSSSA